MQTSVWTTFAVAIVAGLSSAPSHAGGWDYNLTHRCVATTGNPGDTNYYDDRSGCPVPGALTAPPPNHWEIAVETENNLGVSCVGPTNRSLPINVAGSPVTLAWQSHSSDIGPNWTVHMQVDQSANPIPASCASGGDTYTYYVFQDDAASSGGGGPLPNGAAVASSHVVNYSDYEPSGSDGTRFVATATFWYHGTQHEIDINMASTNFGYTPSSNGLLVSKTVPTTGMQWVVLDGQYFGVTASPNTDSFVYIPWNSILDTVIKNNWFPDSAYAPADRSQIATGSIGVAVEVKNHAVASLWHTNFRVAP